MLLPNYYEDPNSLHIGTEPPRCYYIPLREDGTLSGKLLSGNDWNFCYYPNLAAVEEFMKEDFPKIESFDTISVPSCWQMIGYDQKQYTNVRYPFPFDPPYVPAQNPCGAYRKEFVLNAQEIEQEQFLYFEGVDSCFYVWINGEFVGYSQVSHSPSEFRISGKTRTGKNTLSVLVLKWCDGSYLEDQDKFRYSGIFRDVSLFLRPKSYIRDFEVHTQLDSDRNTAEILLNLTDVVGKVDAACELWDAEGALIGQRTISSDEKGTQWQLENPSLWNAERPYLYTLKITAGTETIIQKVGIRSIEIKNRMILINGNQVKLKGVNRHDSSPYTGAAVTKEDVILDLTMMKRANINAIRTSHYPNAPWFPELCNEFGFYLIAEADIEIHGTTTIYGGSGEETFGILAQDPRFETAILDRVQRNVIRDQNQPCVIFWSLGNESGYGPAFEKAGRWVKLYDPSRLLHYEGSIWQTGGHINDTSMLDVVSRMYASTQWIDEYCQNPLSAKPFLQCEFVHAMGNGPGDIEDYLTRMYQYDAFCGGFVWEWCDHATYEGTGEEGRAVFHYGGDAGEFPHDGNFCMDGLVYPDRRPHTGLYEWKNAIRPVRASLCEMPRSGQIQIQLTNTLDFTNLNDCISIRYELKRRGELLDFGTLPSVSVNPHETVTVSLALKVQDLEGCYLKLTYHALHDTAFYQAGYELGFDQLALFEQKPVPLKLHAAPESIRLTETQECYRIENERFCYEFGKETAAFLKMSYGGKEQITAPLQFSTYRAPTDNDVRIDKEWKKAGYDRSVVKVYHTEAKERAGLVVISCDFSIAAVFIQPFLRCHAEWSINGSGEVMLSLTAQRDPEFPFLPRFGLLFSLPEENDRVSYYGYGPYESYIDKHRASWIDRFDTTVGELHEDYVKPQENGSHYGCSMVRVGELGAKAEEPFSFQASYYSLEELASKKHNYELQRSGAIHVHLDIQQSGVGSNSCGPELLKQYRFDAEKFKWNIIFGFGCDSDKLGEGER